MKALLKSALGLGLAAIVLSSGVGSASAQSERRFVDPQYCPYGKCAQTDYGRVIGRQRSDVPVMRRDGPPPFRDHEYRPRPPRPDYYPNYRPYRYRPNYYDPGPRVYLNVAPPVYYDPPVYYERRVVRRARMSEAHVNWCYNRYRSYRAYDNTYQPYGGPRRQCYSPYS